MDFVFIPTFKPKEFTEIPAILAREDDWENTVIENAQNELQKERAVLLIAETMLQAEIFKELLGSKGYDKTKIKLYSRNDNLQQTVTGKRLEAGDVVIATNLAGRGTDLKTSCEVEKKGGLHVVISYLPDNYRNEDQCFGRTSRQGNSGSGQLIINKDDTISRLQSLYPWYQSNDTYNIGRLIEWRDLAEKQRLLQDKICQVPMMDLQSNLFQEFAKFLDQFKHKDRDQELDYNAEVEQIRELWGLWLKEQTKLMDCNITEKLDHKSDFTERNNNITQQVRANFVKFKDDITEKHKNSALLLNPSYLTIRGLLTNSQVDLDRAIELDPNFSFSAHYIKAQILIANNDKDGVKGHLQQALDNINDVIMPLYELPISLMGVKDISNNELPLSKQFRDKINILSTMAENIMFDISVVESAMGEDQIHLKVENFYPLKDAVNNFDKLKMEASEISALGVTGFYEVGTYFVPEENNSFLGNVFAFVVGVFQIVVGAALAVGSTGFLSHLSVGLIVGGIKDVVTTAIATVQGQRIDINQYFKSKGIELAVSVILAGIQTGIEKLGIGETLGFKKATPATFTERLIDNVVITGISAVAKQAMKVGLKKNQGEIEASIRKSVHSMLEAHKEELNKVVAHDVWSNNKQAQKIMLSAAQYMLAKDYQGKYRQVHQQIIRGVAGGMPVVGPAMTAYDMADTLNQVLSITDEFCDKLGSRMYEYAPSDQRLMYAGLKSKEVGFGPYDSGTIISTLSSNDIFSDETLVSGSCSAISSMDFIVFNKPEEKEKIKGVCDKVEDVEDLEFKEQTEKIVNDLENMLTGQIVKMVRNGIFSPLGDMIGSFTWNKLKEFQYDAKENINKEKEGIPLTPEQEESFRKAKVRAESEEVVKEYYANKKQEIPLEVGNAILSGLKARVVDGKLVFEDTNGERVNIYQFKGGLHKQKQSQPHTQQGFKGGFKPNKQKPSGPSGESAGGQQNRKFDQEKHQTPIPESNKKESFSSSEGKTTTTAEEKKLDGVSGKVLEKIGKASKKTKEVLNEGKEYVKENHPNVYKGAQVGKAVWDGFWGVADDAVSVVGAVGKGFASIFIGRDGVEEVGEAICDAKEGVGEWIDENMSPDQKEGLGVVGTAAEIGLGFGAAKVAGKVVKGSGSTKHSETKKLDSNIKEPTNTKHQGEVKAPTQNNIKEPTQVSQKVHSKAAVNDNVKPAVHKNSEFKVAKGKIKGEAQHLM